MPVPVDGHLRSAAVRYRQNDEVHKRNMHASKPNGLHGPIRSLAINQRNPARLLRNYPLTQHPQHVRARTHTHTTLARTRTHARGDSLNGVHRQLSFRRAIHELLERLLNQKHVSAQEIHKHTRACTRTHACTHARTHTKTHSYKSRGRRKLDSSCMDTSRRGEVHGFNSHTTHVVARPASDVVIVCQHTHTHFETRRQANDSTDKWVSAAQRHNWTHLPNQELPKRGQKMTHLMRSRHIHRDSS